MCSLEQDHINGEQQPPSLNMLDMSVIRFTFQLLMDWLNASLRMLDMSATVLTFRDITNLPTLEWQKSSCSSESYAALNSL